MVASRLYNDVVILVALIIQHKINTIVFFCNSTIAVRSSSLLNRYSDKTVLYKKLLIDGRPNWGRLGGRVRKDRNKILDTHSFSQSFSQVTRNHPTLSSQLCICISWWHNHHQPLFPWWCKFYFSKFSLFFYLFILQSVLCFTLKLEKKRVNRSVEKIFYVCHGVVKILIFTR